MVTGKVTSVTNKGIFLRLPGDFRGCVPRDDDDDGDTDDGGLRPQNVGVGHFVRCRVLSCKEKEKCVLSLGTKRCRQDSLTIPQDLTPPASPTGPTDSPKQNLKRKRSHSEQDEPDDKLTVTDKERTSRHNTSGRAHKGRLSSSPSEQTQQKTGKTPTAAESSRLCVADSFLWEEVGNAGNEEDSSSESEEEEKEVPKKKRKKSQAGHQETGKGVSDKSKDFEKLLLSRPDDSMLWIEYMSEHLNAGDIDRARAVGEQALKTISCRDEQDKLNVWIALLNLENMYGSKEQITQTFQRALQVTDPLTLYRRVATMYTVSGKMEEAEQTYQAMVRKFKQEKQTWADFGLFLYKQGRLDAARNLLQRSLLSLQRHDHVGLIGKFAQMEFAHGEPERGTTMFEKIMAEFPRRSDIMSVYIDMVIKSGDHERARELLERAVSSMKNTKFFFKKYLTFEEQNGSEESVARVKAKIESYC